MINIQAILVANAVGIVLLAIILFNTYKRVRFGQEDDRVFYAMVFLNMMQCIFEPMSFLVDGQLFAGSNLIVWTLNSLLFINNIIFSFLFTVYVDIKLFDDLGRIKRIYKYVAIPALLIIIGVVVNLFTPVFFVVTDANVYQRVGLFSWTFYATYGYLLYGAIMIYKYKSETKRYIFLPVVLFLIPVAIGSGLQFLFYGLSLIWIGTAVGLTALYVNLQNEVSYTDSLSGTFTRQYMNQYLNLNVNSKGNRRLAGIMLDIDKFKSINDNFGHLVGDEAISNAGRILIKSVRAEDFVARFAGDEFVIILKIENDNEIKETIKCLREHINYFNSTAGAPYKITFSIGYTVYNPESDNIDKFLGRMDSAMYMDKKRKMYSFNK